uniref:glycophorin-C-like n=1 Tax=Myxine glutinosa TaxID=7769 RepID=UPI00358DDDE4
MADLRSSTAPGHLIQTEPPGMLGDTSKPISSQISTDSAIIAVVAATAIVVALLSLAVVARYLVRHSGTYNTREAKESEAAQSVSIANVPAAPSPPAAPPPPWQPDSHPLPILAEPLESSSSDDVFPDTLDERHKEYFI